MSNVSFLNDYLEVEWFKSRCLEVVEEQLRLLDARPAAKGRVTYAEPLVPLETVQLEVSEHVFAQQRFLSDLKVLLSKDEFDRIFCASFSRTKDDLSQWRGYADGAAGVCIGFDLETIEAANSEWPRLERQEVVYDIEHQRGKASEVITSHFSRVNNIRDAVSQAGLAYASLRILAPRFKNPKFESEQEVRLLVHDSVTGTRLDKAKYDDIVRQQFPSGINFRVHEKKLIPRVEIACPPNAISEIWVGPKFGGRPELAALSLFLNKHGLELDIQRSGASFR